MANVNKRTAAGKPVLNTILQQIPDSEFSELRPHLQFSEFQIAQYLERAGSPINAVYFLNRGVGSLIVETADARSVEVGIAGCEDMIGLTVVGGLEELTYSVVIQAPADGFRASRFPAFHTCEKLSAGLEQLLDSYPLSVRFACLDLAC